MIESVGSHTAPASGWPPASTIFLTSLSCVASSPICGVPVSRPSPELTSGVLAYSSPRPNACPNSCWSVFWLPPLPITMSTRRSCSTSPPVASVSPTPVPLTRVSTLTKPLRAMKSATPPTRCSESTWLYSGSPVALAWPVSTTGVWIDARVGDAGAGSAPLKVSTTSGALVGLVRRRPRSC